MSGQGQRIGVFKATMLVAGNSGVFLMPASMAPNGGISLLGWLVAVPCALLLALVFARLATRRPMAGGPYAWARWGLGNYPGFSCNSLYWLGNVIGNIAIAVSVVGYASVFLPILVGPHAAVVGTLVIIWLAVAANMVGPRLVGTIESATTLFGLLPIVGIASLGWWSGPSSIGSSRCHPTLRTDGLGARAPSSSARHGPVRTPLVSASAIRRAASSGNSSRSAREPR